MVRDALPRIQALAVGALAVVWYVVWTAAAATARAQEAEPAGMAAVADVVLWGHATAPSTLTGELPRDVQTRLAGYRQRELVFLSALTPPPGATPDERQVFEKRVDIERTIFCLFARRDSASVAVQYALDADVEVESDDAAEAPRREAKFIDSLLVNLSKPWLAPYLNLIAGAPQTLRRDGGRPPSARAGPRWRPAADSRRRRPPPGDQSLRRAIAPMSAR